MRARGFVSNPGANVPARGSKLDVGAAVGKGILAVVRHQPGWREPYRGLVPLVSGEIAEDIARYLQDSEQVASAVALVGTLSTGPRERSRPSFACSCDRSRVERALLLLGREEVREIVAKGEPVLVRCEFCAQRYSLAPDEVARLVPDA